MAALVAHEARVGTAHLVPPARRFGGSGESGFHREAALDESSPLVTDRNRERRWKEWAVHRDPGAAVPAGKVAPNPIRCRFLQAMG